jgi:hypothetical protein
LIKTSCSSSCLSEEHWLEKKILYVKTERLSILNLNFKGIEVQGVFLQDREQFNIIPDRFEKTI